DHPHSYEDTLNIWSPHIEEIANSRHKTRCIAYEEILYAKYQEIYPQFIPFAKQAEMRDAWLVSAIQNSMNTNCFFENMRNTLRYSSWRADSIGICGNFSRKPRNET